MKIELVAIYRLGGRAENVQQQPQEVCLICGTIAIPYYRSNRLLGPLANSSNVSALHDAVSRRLEEKSPAKLC